MRKLMRILISALLILVCCQYTHGSSTFVSKKISKELCIYIDTLYNRFTSNYENENYTAALSAGFQIVDSLTAHADIDNVVRYSDCLLIIFFKIGNKALTIKYLDTLSELKKKTRNINTWSKVDFYFAKYYYSQKEYDSCILKLNNCLAKIDLDSDMRSRGLKYLVAGDAYVNLGKFGLANYNYNLALKYYTSGKNLAEISNVYTKIAHIHQLQLQNDKNLEFNRKALNIRLKMDKPAFLASSLLNVGDAYWLLGRNDSAWYYYTKSLELSKTLKGAYNTEMCYQSMRNFCISNGQYADAFYYNEKRAEYHSKVLFAKNNTDISIFLATRAINEREVFNERIKQEIMLKNLQIKNKKNQTITLELSLVACLSLVFFIDFMIRVNKKKREVLSALNVTLEQEIENNDVAAGLLYQREELHRFLAENTSDVITVLDADLRLKYVSRSCESLYGYTPAEIMEIDDCMELVDVQSRTTFNRQLLEMLYKREPNHCIYKAIRKDKELFWSEANFHPVKDENKQCPAGIKMVVRDISERKQFEEDLSLTVRQKELMLKEIHNRVKNNFTILGSLVSMVMSHNLEPKLVEAYNDLHLRLRTMSLVHEQLYKSQEINIIPLDIYLQNLYMIISGTFRTSEVEMVTEFASCRLSIENALPVGLIMNELLINSFKYAFPENVKGRIVIRLFPVNDDHFCLMIADNGVGLPEDFSAKSSKTMGTQIVKLLVQQIDGKMTVSNDNGACFSIVFPINKTLANA